MGTNIVVVKRVGLTVSLPQKPVAIDAARAVAMHLLCLFFDSCCSYCMFEFVANTDFVM